MRTTLRLFAFALGVLVLASARPARAQCVYNVMSSGTAYTASAAVGSNVDYQFTQSNVYWSAVAVNPASGTDWDINLFATTAAFPTCLAGPLASSVNTSGTDFVMVNFNTTPTGTYFARAHHFGGAGNGTVEWQGGANLLYVNGPQAAVVTGSTTIVQTYDVFLSSGTTYTFPLTHFGAGATRMLLFKPTGGVEFLSRNGAEFAVSTSTTYAATVSGYYALVVVNDDGNAAQDNIGVGVCTAPTALADVTPANSGTNSENDYSFNQDTNFWTAVAVRGTGANDWDIESYANPSGSSYPVCLGGVLSSSAGSPPNVDFVVGDFNFNTEGTYYVRSHLFQDLGSTPAQTEWARGHTVLNANGPAVSDNTGPNAIIRIYDVLLQGGVHYTFLFSPSGAGTQRMLLFRNPGGTTYWAGRGSAEFSATGNQNYTAPSSGYYGLVVVNDDGVAGSYSVRYGTCDFGPQIMIAGTNYGTGNSEDYWSFNQQTNYWTVIGTQGLPSDYDIRVNSTLGGAGFPACESGELASSPFGSGTTDFVVGDFNYNPFGVYYARTYTFNGGDAPGSRTEWESGSDLVSPGGATISENTNQEQLVAAWDALLSSGTNYTFRFNPHGLANLHLLLFRNAAASTYWAGRSAAEFDMTAGQHTYAAPATAFYGVVVVNDNNQYGYYDFRIDGGTVSVDASGPPTSTGLTGVSPNPSRGGTNIDFALARPGEVALELLDPSGRRVASLGGSFEAGHQQLTWDGRDAAGARLSAGLYFVRMRVAGRDVGTRRITLLQ